MAISRASPRRVSSATSVAAITVSSPAVACPLERRWSSLLVQPDGAAEQLPNRALERRSLRRLRIVSAHRRAAALPAGARRPGTPCSPISSSTSRPGGSSGSRSPPFRQRSAASPGAARRVHRRRRNRRSTSIRVRHRGQIRDVDRHRALQRHHFLGPGAFPLEVVAEQPAAEPRRILEPHAPAAVEPRASVKSSRSGLSWR